MSLRLDTWLAFDVWVELGEGLEKLERLHMVRKVTKSTEQCLSDLGDAEKAKKALVRRDCEHRKPLKIKEPLMYRVEYFRTSTKYPSFTVKQRDSRRDPVTLCTTWNVL